MKVTIFGAGYVGLVTSTCLAHMGHDVLCYEINQDKVAKLNASICPIYEKGLPELLNKQLQENRLAFTTDIAEAIAFSTLYIIAVGTPEGNNGEADLSQVLSVAHSLGEHITSNITVVNKSTVPVGTAKTVRIKILETLALRHESFDVLMVSNPEFLKQGVAVDDFMMPDRLIVGADHNDGFEIMRELYAPIFDDNRPMIEMDLASAELSKYAANVFLASKISFMNELSQIAEKVGADIESIKHGMGFDPRISPHFLNAGCGYGGSCFPKDVAALTNLAEGIDVDAAMLKAIARTNNTQKELLFHKVSHYFSGDLKGKTIAIWGLAFKPETDDLREATSCVLIDLFLQAGMKIRVFDPVVKSLPSNSVVMHVANKEQALENADALVIVTEWNAFKVVDFNLIKNTLNTPVIFDGRNLYDPVEVEKYDIEYYPIGRGKMLWKHPAQKKKDHLIT